MEYTVPNIAAIAGVAGSVFAIVSGFVKFLVSYLEAKFSGKMTVAEQSAQCRFDHEQIGSTVRAQANEVNSMIQNQNEHIARLLDQNGKQLQYMSDASHNAELRHQITMAKLENIEKIMEKSG